MQNIAFPSLEVSVPILTLFVLSKRYDLKRPMAYRLIKIVTLYCYTVKLYFGRHRH